MDDVRIILSALWAATMLTYLLGDVLRIMSGDVTAGEMMGRKVTQGMWVGMATLMVIPVVMVVLSLTVPYPVTRGANLIVAIFWFGFNLIGLPTYPSAYDKGLLLVSMGV